MNIEHSLGAWSTGLGPLHRKLAGALRAAIGDGRLPGGARIPSERELAMRLHVSRSTVVAAYDALRGEGLLQSRQGSGSRVVAGAGPTAVDRDGPDLSPIYRSLLAGDERDVLSLACAVTRCHPAVHEELSAIAAQAGELLAGSGYQPLGLPSLREAVAALLSRTGLPTTPGQVIVTSGAQQAIVLAAECLVGPGRDVVVESPGFPGTIDAFRFRGARLVAVPVDGEGVDADAVAAAVAAHPPAAIYLMPSFHNPTGAALSEHRRRRLAELSATSGVPILEDNALEHLRLDVDPPPPIAAFAPEAPIVTAGSLSKVAWGGLRLGWLRAPEPLMGRLSRVKAMSDLGTPMLDQAVGARLVPRIEELARDRRVELRRSLADAGELLGRLLPAWRWQPPTGGPSLWVELPTGTASSFAQVALRHGVEVIPGEVMSPTGEHRRHLRLPYVGERPVLEAVVYRLARAWDAYRPATTPLERPFGVVV